MRILKKSQNILSKVFLLVKLYNFFKKLTKTMKKIDSLILELPFLGIPYKKI
jgi:hypothetical protein